MPSYTRQTAQFCTLSELKRGSFEGDSVRAGDSVVGRVNVIGVIVRKVNENAFYLDDGTTTIQCRRFDEHEIDADVGDMVLVIGKPREYDDERYLVLEICKRLANKGWVEYRKRELEHFMGTTPEAPPPAEEDTGPAEKLIDAIRKLDDGKGADRQAVTDSVPEGERLVKNLMEEGEIFEIRPGRLKVLE